MRDKEQKRLYDKARYEAKREELLAQKRAYYLANREALIAKVAARTDSEAKHAYDIRYNQRPEVRERRAKQRKAWAEAHPDKTRAWSKASSARRRAAPYDSTAKEYAVALLRDPCAYCGGLAGQIDHIDPLKLGGDSHWSNLTAACQSCNYSKRDKPMLVYLGTY
jgi:5-methylcytosine-specific restriction endonuclease McrA